MSSSDPDAARGATIIRDGPLEVMLPLPAKATEEPRALLATIDV